MQHGIKRWVQGLARALSSSCDHACMVWASIERATQVQPMQWVTGGIGPHPAGRIGTVVHAHEQDVLKVEHRLGPIHLAWAKVIIALPLPALAIPLQHADRAAPPGPKSASAGDQQGSRAQPGPPVCRSGPPPTHSDQACQTPTAQPQAPHKKRTPHGKRHRWGVGRAHSCQGRFNPDPAERAAQTRLNTSVPLVPPKPKLFFTATSIFRSRAVLAQ